MRDLFWTRDLLPNGLFNVHSRPHHQSPQICTSLQHGICSLHRRVRKLQIYKSNKFFYDSSFFQVLVHDWLQEDAGNDVLKTKTRCLDYLLFKLVADFIFCDVGKIHRLHGLLCRDSNHFFGIYALWNRADELQAVWRSLQVAGLIKLADLIALQLLVNQRSSFLLKTIADGAENNKF